MATQIAPALSPDQSRALIRWLEDRALEFDIPSLDALAEAAGMTSNKMTICTKHPGSAHPAEVMGLAKVLRVHWFEDLVEKWGFGSIRFNLLQLQKEASKEGFNIGLVVNQAA